MFEGQYHKRSGHLITGGRFFVRNFETIKATKEKPWMRVLPLASGHLTEVSALNQA
jgi:hypothetical protein